MKLIDHFIDGKSPNFPELSSTPVFNPASGEETSRVVSGTAEIEIDGQIMKLKKNQSTYIPIGSKHRISNPFKKKLVLIEVQSGSYLGEDDIIRLEDKYNRQYNKTFKHDADWYVFLKENKPYRLIMKELKEEENYRKAMKSVII